MRRCGPTSPTTMRQTCSACPNALLRLDNPHRLAVKPGANVLDDVVEIFPVILLAHIAEMRCDDDVVHLAEWMIERKRLDIENVEPGAGNGLRLERCDQRFLVNYRAAGRVDEVSRFLHQPQLFCTDQSARAVTEHKMDGDEIRVAEEVLLRHVVRASGLGFLFGEVLAPSDGLHAEGLADRG